jgi:hypothetical protein
MYTPLNGGIPFVVDEPLGYQDANDIAADLADHETRILALAGGNGIVATPMTDAQFKALPSTPFEIAPADVGAVNMPRRIMLFGNLVSGYSNVGTGDSYVVGTVNGHEVTGYLGRTTVSGYSTVLTQLSTLLATAGRRRYVIPGEYLDDRTAPFGGGWGLIGDVWDYSDHISQPLMLTMVNSNGNLTGGSPSNQWLVVTEVATVEAP